MQPAGALTALLLRPGLLHYSTTAAPWLMALQRHPGSLLLHGGALCRKDRLLRFDDQHQLLVGMQVLQSTRQSRMAAYFIQGKWGQGFSSCAGATTNVPC